MSEFTVEIDSTSNPNIKKFTVNSFLTKAQSFEFHSAQEAKNSPLALELFQFPFIKTVFVSQNFIAIEKLDGVAWELIAHELKGIITDYLNNGLEVIIETKPKKLPTTVYVESTPNPAVMKFITNRLLVENSVEYKHVSEARNSPLVQELFTFPFVKEVFFNKNYISIMKFEMISWEEITMEIREFLRKYLESGKKVISDDTQTGELLSSIHNSEFETKKELTPFETKIVSVIEEYILPAVAQDGGNIALDSYDPETKTVHVILQGACSGCPSSTVTLKNGIERLLKQMIGSDIEHVSAING